MIEERPDSMPFKIMRVVWNEANQARTYIAYGRTADKAYYLGTEERSELHVRLLVPQTGLTLNRHYQILESRRKVFLDLQLPG
jgi:hypothetical protein